MPARRTAPRRPANATFPPSHPLSGAEAQGQWRVQLDAVQHPAHGRHADAQPFHRMVRPHDTPARTRVPSESPARLRNFEKEVLTWRLYRAGMVYSVQNWLGESEVQKKNATTPGYFNVAMACTSQRSPLLTVVADSSINSRLPPRLLPPHVPPAHGEPPELRHRSCRPCSSPISAYRLQPATLERQCDAGSEQETLDHWLGPSRLKKCRIPVTQMAT